MFSNEAFISQVEERGKKQQKNNVAGETVQCNNTITMLNGVGPEAGEKPTT